MKEIRMLHYYFENKFAMFFERYGYRYVKKCTGIIEH